MARRARLVLPQLAHLVSLRALAGLHPCPSAEHQHQLLALLHESAGAEGLQLHAYALLHDELRLLATPTTEAALSRGIQAFGRRYVGYYNRACARAGTLWAGRFRSAALQPGPWVVQALRYVDGAAAADTDLTSAPGRTGAAARIALVDPPEYWALGNTPFERERRYAELLAQPLDPAVCERIARCLAGGWPCGDESYLRSAEATMARPTRPRARGRPPKRREAGHEGL